MTALPDGVIDGFARRRLPGKEVEIDALVGGDGPPLLLLHGYPQTRLIWKQVAPRLAERFTVVIPDLRGYGRSEKPEGDAAHNRYSKRTMALDQIATMQSLGFERFAIAGHDRGGRVAYRLALDHPEAVTKIAVLDIMPTAETWAAADASAAIGGFHWYLLAQPQPLPETLIGSDPAFFARTLLTRWAGEGFAFDPESLADYLACFSDPASVHATCEDYRAGWTVDREHDEADRGQRQIQAPLLVLWGAEDSVTKDDPIETWKRWAGDVRGHELPSGHFLSEEAPEETTAALLSFFGDGV